MSHNLCGLIEFREGLPIRQVLGKQKTGWFLIQDSKQDGTILIEWENNT